MTIIDRALDADPGRSDAAGRRPPIVTVVGSLNMDLVLEVERLPQPGETVTGRAWRRQAGGKGGNQAVALSRLGATTRMVGCVGDDDYGRHLVDALVSEGVHTDFVRTVDRSTGTAYILVEPGGENQIVVTGGANSAVEVDRAALAGADAVLCQFEVPPEVVERVAASTEGFFCLNAAPARPLSSALISRADLIIVNETEYAAIEGLDECQLVALTLGADGAVLLAHGSEVARSGSPQVDAVDTVAAGDAFCAAMLLGLLRGGSWQETLERACAAGSIAASRPGAQASLPTHTELAEW